MSELAVEMTAISKRFGDVQALDQVDLSVRKGSIHAVVGENGAGKTTLMKALYGAMIPDSGQIKVNGRLTALATSAQAIGLGVGMVSQHYGIIGELTCLENLVLGAEGTPVLPKSAMHARANELAQKMGFQFDWDAEASTLSPASGQKLEILKLLWRSSEIMILDEPTAMLSPQDGRALFDSLRELAENGSTILVVTHRLSEVFDYSEHVTVLRGGRRVADCPVSETTPDELARLIVGGEVIGRNAPSGLSAGATLLSVRDLSALGDKGEVALKGCNFAVSRGEIVGVAGVDGNGQRELFRCILGVQKPTQGTIHWLEEDLTARPTRDRIAKGIRVIAEDRLSEAIIEEWSLAENVALGLQRLEPFAKGKSMAPSAQNIEAEKVADVFNTKRGSVSQAIGGLSGGNQQRFVAARALAYDPQLILAFQPARGLDLNSTTLVYQAIRERCEEGAGALVVSFDLDELLEFCDRIVVLNHGELAEPGPDLGRDREAIGRLMVGAL